MSRETPLSDPYLPCNLVPGHALYDNDDVITTPKQELLQGLIDEKTGYLVPGTPKFYEILHSKEFEVREDDVWLVTYPKSGTTLTWHTILKILSDGDPDKVLELNGKFRSSNMGRIELYICEKEQERVSGYKEVKSPRVFGSHLAEEYIPEAVKKQNKVIVVMRNPKDACVSYFHFHRMNSGLGTYTGTFENFYEKFMTNKTYYGSWFDHTKNWWQKHKNDSNFLFLFFEDIISNRKETVRRLAKFIGKPVTEKCVETIVEETQFDNMKKSLHGQFAKVNAFDLNISHFMRKGEIGDWKNHFTVNQNDHFNKIYEEKMKDVPDLNFKFE